MTVVDHGCRRAEHLAPHLYDAREMKKEVSNKSVQKSFKLEKRVFHRVLQRESPKLTEAISRGFRTHLSIIVLGADAIRADHEMIYNFGTLSINPALSTSRLERFFTGLHPDESQEEIKGECQEHITEGSIVNEAHWYPFMNDCFIYGAILGRKEFHLAMRATEVAQDIVWDKKYNRPTVLGREILMLKFSGYTATPKGDYGVVFIPPCESVETNKPASVTDYRKRIASVTKAQPILFYIKGR